MKLRSGTSGSLDSLVNLSGGVSSSRADTSLLKHGEKVDARLETDRGGEVVMLRVDLGGGRAGAVLVVFVLPETLLVVALKIGPDLLQRGDQITDLRNVELSTTVSGPGTVVVLGPETMDDPIVEVLGSRVAARSGANRPGPTNSKKYRACQDQIASVSNAQKGRTSKINGESPRD